MSSAADLGLHVMELGAMRGGDVVTLLSDKCVRCDMSEIIVHEGTVPVGKRIWRGDRVVKVGMGFKLKKENENVKREKGCGEGSGRISGTSY